MSAQCEKSNTEHQCAPNTGSCHYLFDMCFGMHELQISIRCLENKYLLGQQPVIYILARLKFTYVCQNGSWTSCNWQSARTYQYVGIKTYIFMGMGVEVI